ncbi:MAG: hypothetical protein AAGG38_03375 [Planctomycetota bacterium]
MNDRHDPNLILGYVEDDLTPDQRADFDALLRSDHTLAALVADLQAQRALLRGTPPPPPPPGLADAATARLERRMLLPEPDDLPPAPSSSRRRRLMPLVAYSGVAAVVTLTAAVVFQSLRSDPTDPAGSTFSRPGVGLAQAPIEAQRQAMLPPRPATSAFDQDDHSASAAESSPPATVDQAMAAENLTPRDRGAFGRSEAESADTLSARSEPTTKVPVPGSNQSLALGGRPIRSDEHSGGRMLGESPTTPSNRTGRLRDRLAHGTKAAETADRTPEPEVTPLSPQTGAHPTAMGGPSPPSAPPRPLGEIPAGASQKYRAVQSGRPDLRGFEWHPRSWYGQPADISVRFGKRDVQTAALQRRWNFFEIPARDTAASVLSDVSSDPDIPATDAPTDPAETE